ncbi:MAG: hypothetical protein R8K50_02165 [Mariprofundus sp.]
MNAAVLPCRSKEQGYSLIKVMIWLVILGAVSWHGMKFVKVYYVSWKVQSMFDGIVEKMADADVADVRVRIPDLLKINYIDKGDLPVAFYDELQIVDEGLGINISSQYSETIWLLGDIIAVDENGDYDPDKLVGMDQWRDRARIVLNFSPHAGLQ